MAATVSADALGNKALVIDVAGDASYPTGGYALSLSNLGNRTVYGINDGQANIPLWDPVNLKVKFIVAATGLEVANATNVSAVTLKLLVV